MLLMEMMLSMRPVLQELRMLRLRTMAACLLAVIMTTANQTRSVTAEDMARRPKVLFIGVDGCRWDAVEAATTPQWDLWADGGTLALGTEILAPREAPGDTVSGPGWSNLLCGVWPDKHGVIDNSFRAPRYEQFPHVFHRVKQARPDLKTASFSSWPPIAEKIVSHADVLKNYPSQNLEEYVVADAQATADCAALLSRGEPVDFVFVYLGQVDETGHRYGFHPSVPQYLASIEQVDQHLHRLATALEQRPTRAEEDWLILIATDHGGAGTGHGGGRENPDIHRTFLIASGPSAVCQRVESPTYQVDIVATALAHLRIPMDPAWQLDGTAVGLRPR
jgi:predicted AlkP superfamily pyrophosphatase or phosphodiesterase